MNKEPLISILIPVYNTQKYLKRCLNSVINQTYQNLEIIVVNDGSTDNSQKIIDEFAKLDSRIKTFLKPNEKNIAKVRNFSLAHKNGEYFTFVDSDDYINKNHIKNLYENLKKYNSDLSICGYFINVWRLPRFSWEFKTGKMDQENGLQEIILGNKLNVTLWNKLFKSSLADGFSFDENVKTGEDVLFCYKYARKCETISYTRKKTYNYYLRPKSEIHQKFSDKHISYIHGLNDLLENETNETYKDCLRAMICLNCSFYLLKMKRAKWKNPEIANVYKTNSKIYKKQLLSNTHASKIYKLGYRFLYNIYVKK